MHRNLSFPLLQELVKAGDPLARKIFKEEIAKRLKEGLESRDFKTIHYLWNEKYFNHLSKEEINILFESANIKKLNLRYWKITTLPKWITKLTSLQVLNLERNELTTLPRSISKLASLQILNLRGNSLKSPPKMKKLRKKAEEILSTIQKFSEVN